MAEQQQQHKGFVSISSLLKRLSTTESTKNVKAEEVAAALALSKSGLRGNRTAG